MQIALTKKLATASGIKPKPADDTADPLFTWTANWTNVWANRKEDMLVLVNNATRFTVAIYEVKKGTIKNIEKMVSQAIANTLLDLNLNPEIVEAYMQMAGEISFVRNNNRSATAWVSRAGLECAIRIGDDYRGIDKVYSDVLGSTSNKVIVNHSKDFDDAFYPYELMFKKLSDLTGQPIYQYKAFKLLITLDLDLYEAKRTIIVPAKISFEKLHKILQSIFNWKNYHLYDFTVLNCKTGKEETRLVPFEEDLNYDYKAILMGEQPLLEHLTEEKEIIYTYDMGDYWQHKIQLIEVIDNYDKESPYLLEAEGQAPPEDVGGVGGYIEFYEIMQNEDHPEYEAMVSWSGYWSLELPSWRKKPRVI